MDTPSLSTPDPAVDSLLGSIRQAIVTITGSSHRERPEQKSLAPDGSPVASQTTGLLPRRPVESDPTITDLGGSRSGGTSIGLLLDPDEYGNSYGDRVGEPFREVAMARVSIARH